MGPDLRRTVSEPREAQGGGLRLVCLGVGIEFRDFFMARSG